MSDCKISWIFADETIDLQETIKINTNVLDVEPNKFFYLKARFKILVSKAGVNFVTYQDCTISYRKSPYYLGIGTLDGLEFKWLGGGLDEEQKNVLNECLEHYKHSIFLMLGLPTKAEGVDALDTIVEKALQGVATHNRNKKLWSAIN